MRHRPGQMNWNRKVPQRIGDERNVAVSDCGLCVCTDCLGAYIKHLESASFLPEVRAVDNSMNNVLFRAGDCAVGDGGSIRWAGAVAGGPVIRPSERDQTVWEVPFRGRRGR